VEASASDDVDPSWGFQARRATGCPYATAFAHAASAKNEQDLHARTRMSQGETCGEVSRGRTPVQSRGRRWRASGRQGVCVRGIPSRPRPYHWWSSCPRAIQTPEARTPRRCFRIPRTRALRQGARNRYRIPSTDESFAAKRAAVLVELGQALAGTPPDLANQWLTKAGAADSAGLERVRAPCAP
jgi:hypothetical protein